MGVISSPAAVRRWSLPSAPKLDWAKLMSNQHTELERLSTLYQKGLEGAGAKYFEARGRVTGPHSVEVAGQSFKASPALDNSAPKISLQLILHCCKQPPPQHRFRRPELQGKPGACSPPRL